MSNRETKLEGSAPLTARQVALVDIAERQHRDPTWSPQADPAYGGLHPAFIRMMSDAEYERHMAGKGKRGQSASNPCERPAIEQVERQVMPRPMARAALPFGQRIRELRRALGWTQREAGIQLGVSARSIMRYEQGIASPIQSGPLLALRRLESAHLKELGLGFPSSPPEIPAIFAL